MRGSERVETEEIVGDKKVQAMNGLRHCITNTSRTRVMEASAATVLAFYT